MSIYIALKNFKNQSTRSVQPHAEGIVMKDSFIVSEDGDAQPLVESGLVRLVEGAATVEEAAKVVAAEIEAAKPKLNVKDSANRSDNTWGPKPDAAKPAEPAADANAKVEEKPAADANTSAPGSGQPIVGAGDKAPEDTGANL